MSWASHNPSMYDEIIRKGILHYIDSRLNHNGFEVPGDWLEGCRAFVETCQTDPQLRSVYDHLERLATADIVKAEQDYFGGLTDAIRSKEE